MIAAPTRSTVTALKAFFRIADAWLVNREQKAVLLGSSTRSIDRWGTTPAAADPSRDQLERISYILGIYGGLHSVFGEVALADEWVRRPNADFGDRTPLDRMLAGNVGDLATVRMYVDQWVAGP